MDVAKKSVNRKSSSKPKIAVLTRNVRRSICEPNLQTNKPTRILNSDYKRKSLLPTSRKSTIPMDAEIEIPLLMNKILKITNDTTTQMVTEEVEQEQRKEQQINELKPNTTEKRRSVMTTMKTRTSLIPSAAATGDKRPFSFTQRMSVVVKTTLNSPARKMARKSSIGVMSSMQRRSVIPQKTTNTENSKLKKPEVIARKSMLPRTSVISTTTKLYNNTMAPLQEASGVKPIPRTQRKSLYPLTKDSEKNKITSTGGLSHNKIDISYTCNVCKEKFRIKSLLDAHKRSHEGDIATPAFIKKPTVTSLPSGNGNQCKYCDKKFALTKALHIHLLQNCSKIPPSEKRKLQYTDLNHVEKAQLPNVFAHHHNTQSNTSSAVSSTNATPRHAVKYNTNSTTNSTESIHENKGK